MEYQICKRCVLDTTAKHITFDADGYCNYCCDFLEREKVHVLNNPVNREQARESLISSIKRKGRNKRYDCIVGISGGVDSSWALVKAVKLGLRPLAVHMDNGWNSELAQHNIENLVKKLDVDLYTYVIDWEEYRKLMQAFFDVDVIDIELLYDNAMLAVNYNQAAKNKVKYILAGYNQVTEGMGVPNGWNWNKFDRKNIISIGASQNVKVDSFPAIGASRRFYLQYMRNTVMLPFLDYFEFSKESALKLLTNEFNYKPYPYKHYESVFTRFYQGYILPRKFNVDKRRAHFSNLIVTGQMSRIEAIEKLQGIPYPSEREMEDDRQYFLKKMKWTDKDLDDYLSRPERLHSEFGSEEKLAKQLVSLPELVSPEIRKKVSSFLARIR